MIICTFDPVYCFQHALYHKQSIDYASVMLSIYATLSSHLLLAVQKREREDPHMQGTVSKIENSSYCQELVSHPMPVC